jgi:hypothetical protein
MSKYDPLTHHLAQRGYSRIPMGFSELETLLGFGLPDSARKHRAWWSNNPSNSVMTKAWLAAGYRSEQVDLEAEKLVFAKLNEVDPTPSATVQEPTPKGRHPLIGCMRGTFTIMSGTDLTEPTEPDWEDQLLAKFDRLLGPKS